MIQRIQTIYLLLTTILAGLFLTGDIFKLISGVTSKLIMNFRGIFEITAENDFTLSGKVFPVFLVSVLLPLISFISIFLYKNRNIQLKVTLILIILEVLLTVLITYYTIRFIQRFEASLVPGFRMFIPLILVVFSIMAYRGIKRDENLVRSYDRLR